MNIFSFIISTKSDGLTAPKCASICGHTAESESIEVTCFEGTAGRETAIILTDCTRWKYYTPRGTVTKIYSTTFLNNKIAFNIDNISAAIQQKFEQTLEPFCLD